MLEREITILWSGKSLKLDGGGLIMTMKISFIIIISFGLNGGRINIWLVFQQQKRSPIVK